MDRFFTCLLFIFPAQTIPQQQHERKMLIRKMCNENKKLGVKITEDGIDKNLIVDDAHRIIYCFIPKVACTNWKRIMFILRHGKPYPDPITIDQSLVHGHNKFKVLENLKNYTKFLFVRDPFVRLISAYRDKFQYKPMNEYFYQNFGKVMLKRYANQSDPPKTMKEAYALKKLPSFRHFIQYLLDPQTEKKEPFDIHWRQMHRLCHPCLIDYDFIGHQETLQEDAGVLLKMLKLEDDIQFPPSENNMTTSDSVRDWFRPVPSEDRKRLYELYEKDFRMFGYRKPRLYLGFYYLPDGLEK
uniref:Carbohydrate sulfotransferase n=1 Tax=Oryzias melastigma TaxID=30732 RepID=A0A3B3BR23_ORYME